MSQNNQDEPNTTLSPLTLREAIEVMCKTSRRKVHTLVKKLETRIDGEWDDPFMEYAKQPGFMCYLAEIAGYRFTVLKKPKPKNTLWLMFDGGLLPSSTFVAGSRLYYWILSARGVLKFKGITLPPIYRVQLPNNKHLKPVPDLYQSILGVPSRQGALQPQTIDQLNELCLKAANETKNNISCSAIVSHRPACTESSIKIDHGHDQWVHFFAYRDEQFKIRFATNVYAPPTKRFLHQAEQWQKRREHMDQLETSRYDIVNNRSSSVHIKEFGLNLALRLGLLTFTQLQQISTWLACMTSFLFFQFSKTNKDDIIFGTYLDLNEVFHTHLKKDTDWNLLFTKVMERRTILSDLKRSALAPLLEKLEPFRSGPPSPWKRCLMQLEECIEKQMVYVYDSDDSTLCLLKYPWVRFLKHYMPPKRFMGSCCKFGSDGALMALYQKYVIIKNLSMYVNIKENTDFERTHEGLWQGAKDWKVDLDQCPRSLPAKASAKQKMEQGGYNHAMVMYNTWQNINLHFLNQFSLDLTTSTSYTLASLSNHIFWLLYLKIGSFFSHPIEQPLPYNIAKLRQHSHGGVSYSAQRRLAENDPMPSSPEERASIILGLDISSCYGYCATQIQAAGGFGTTFDHGLQRETVRRHRSFEFMAVFYTLYRWMQLTHTKLVSAYHNYSPLGVFTIAKHPIDLVGFFDNGEVQLVNFDGSFAHGCYQHPMCPTLPRYVCGQSRQQVEAKTKHRDVNIETFISTWATHFPIQYRVMTECCTAEYSKKDLLFQFRTILDLVWLVSGYEDIREDIDACPDTMTFLCIAEIEMEQDVTTFPKFGPIFRKTNDEPELTGFGRKMLLTKDYYRYLKSIGTIKPLQPEWILYYKRDVIFNQVFEHLLDLKNNCSSESVCLMYKKIINLSCGYFGSNPANKMSYTYRLTDHTPQPLNLAYHRVRMIDEKRSEFFMVETARPRLGINTIFPVPQFSLIIEYGKLRLHQLLHYLQTHLKPSSFDVLYIHIDGLIMALSADSLLEAVPSEKQHAFQLENVQYFQQDKAGHFKHDLSLLRGDDWQFATANLLSYGYICQNQSPKGKMPNLNKQNANRAFEIQCNQLDNIPTSVTQWRRTDKKMTTEMTEKTFIF